MVVHEIRYADDNGRVGLGEFLRLAGLVAAGAADPDDLAHELAVNEATLYLTDREKRHEINAGWYDASYEAYKAWMAADEVANDEDRANATEAALADYRELVCDAARWLEEISTVSTVARVPVAGRHLHVVKE